MIVLLAGNDGKFNESIRLEMETGGMDFLNSYYLAGSLKNADIKFRPCSVNNLDPMPCRLNICVA